MCKWNIATYDIDFVFYIAFEQKFIPFKSKGIFDIYDITKVSDIPSYSLQTMLLTNQSLDPLPSCESFG